MPSQPQAESDNSYTGFASRLDPANLPPGILQAAQNVRLQRGIAQPRKGCKRLTDATFNSLTMVGSGVWIDSLGRDNIVLVFSDRMYLYRPAQIGYAEATLGPYTYPTGRFVTANIVIEPIQALDKIIIFRGQYDDTSCSATISNSSILNGATGTITVTTSIPHGYATGDEVTVRSLLLELSQHWMATTSLRQPGQVRLPTSLQTRLVFHLMPIQTLLGSRPLRASLR